MADADDALLQGLRKVGLTAPPPGFGAAPQQQAAASGSQGMEFDDVHLTSIFRLALDEDGVFRPQQPQQQQPQPMLHLHQQQFQQMPPGAYMNQQGFHMQQPPPHMQQHGFPGGPQFQQQQPPPMHFMHQGMPSSPGSNMMQMPRGAPMVQMSFSPQQQPQQFMPPRGMAFPPQGFPPLGLPFNSQPAPESRETRFKDYERMKGREIGYIVRGQLRTVETGDEFADDFYFIQAEDKKRLLRSMPPQGHPNHGQNLDDLSNDERPAELLKVLKSIQNRSDGADSGMGHPIIRAPTGPLPELPGGKSSQQEALDRKSKQSTSATTKWAGAKNVLGRSVKGNLRTPRELIALQQAILSDEGDKTGKTECFAGAGWKLRRVTMEVSDILGEVNDLSRHLKARAAAMPGGHATAGWEFFHEKLRELEQQQQDACERLAKAMGLVDADDALLLSLLWLPKGRRTALKAMKSLLAEHLLMLLEAAARMLVYFTCTSPDGKSSSMASEKEKYELDMQAANSLSREFSRVDLVEATKCLRLFLESQTPESLRAVIATPGGALVTKSLLIHGQEMSEASPDAELKIKWDDAFTVFIGMAEEGISAKENK